MIYSLDDWDENSELLAETKGKDGRPAVWDRLRTAEGIRRNLK